MPTHCSSFTAPCLLPGGPTWRAGPFCITDTTLAPDDVEEGHRTGVINNRLLYLEVRAWVGVMGGSG